MEELRTRRALEALQASQRSVRIEYENGEGEVSQRSIVPLEYYERWGHHYVRAYCYRRHEQRTFALRRLEIIDEHAGSLGSADEDLTARPGLTSAPVLAADPLSTTAPSSRKAPPAAEPAPRPAGPPSAAPPPPAAKAGAASAKNTDSSGLGEFFRLTFTIAGMVVILWALFSSGTFAEYLSGGGSQADESGSYQASFRGAEASGGAGAHAAGRATPAPPSTWTYRGYRLSRGPDGSGGRVTCAQLGRSFDSGRQAHYYINSQLFYQRTGLSDSRLLARYMGADTDRNGHLSWSEVEAFQRQTYRLFTYRANHRALPPDEFLARRGGDCEDFALYTCGLLEFWGWNCKVASFFPPGSGSGHAIAMVWSARPINGYGYIHVSGASEQSGGASDRNDRLHEAAYTTAYLRPGYWIPIDYDSIGRFSQAMSSNWTLWDLYDPVEIYGAVM